MPQESAAGKDKSWGGKASVETLLQARPLAVWWVKVWGLQQDGIGNVCGRAQHGKMMLDGCGSGRSFINPNYP